METLHHEFDDDVPLIIGSIPKQGRGRGIVSPAITPLGRLAYARRCPSPKHGGAVQPPRLDLPSTYGARGLYSRASRKVMACLREPAVLFEKASIDEAYLDVTETVGGDWTQRWRSQISCNRHQERVNLTASFGIGPTRIVAKMSSEVNKPNGIHASCPTRSCRFSGVARSGHSRHWAEACDPTG